MLKITVGEALCSHLPSGAPAVAFRARRRGGGAEEVDCRLLHGRTGGNRIVDGEGDRRVRQIRHRCPVDICFLRTDRGAGAFGRGHASRFGGDQCCDRGGARRRAAGVGDEPDQSSLLSLLGSAGDHPDGGIARQNPRRVALRLGDRQPDPHSAAPIPPRGRGSGPARWAGRRRWRRRSSAGKSTAP